ncbi:MAG: hypothetical protein K0R70_1875 [Steroidobacteraceae bacterium]|jgi:hypothetical protein|nr:hypothetical protein [Steroidobacteraceae bacterium]
MAEKPTGKKPPAAADPDPNEPGRLERDDRGNVTWQWSDDQNLNADDTLGAAERLRALIDPGLDVQDEQENPLSPVQSNTKGLKTGYNPYNSGALGKQAWKKKKDLRRLSKWIELKKKMSDTKE